jgi:hypothetical protein
MVWCEVWFGYSSISLGHSGDSRAGKNVVEGFARAFWVVLMIVVTVICWLPLHEEETAPVPFYNLPWDNILEEGLPVGPSSFDFAIDQEPDRVYATKVRPLLASEGPLALGKGRAGASPPALVRGFAFVYGDTGLKRPVCGIK